MLDCRRCPRLAGFLEGIRERYPDYHARPVPAFGEAEPRLLVVGLAPGLHGANRTGRPFTGDHAGLLLYRLLHRNGFASAPVSVSAEDGLALIDCRISNAVKCVPPQNAPRPDEIRTCNAYLARELEALPRLRMVLALGTIAHKAVLMARGLRASPYPFAHAARHVLPDGLVLYDSYHCSRYNTQTGRLTEEGFDAVFRAIRQELGAAGV